MGRARIENEIGGGEYQIDYLFNVELINFEIERLKALRDEIDPNKLLEATQERDDTHAATVAAGEHLSELLLQLRGFVSPAVITHLESAVTALESADTTLGQASNQRSNAGIALNASVAAFPSSPPAEVTAAYTAAFSALATAAFHLTDEAHALAESLTATTTARNAAGAGVPDPETVRTRMQEALETFAGLLAASAVLVVSLANAANAVQDARGTLPSGSEWDLANTQADNAAVALTNSDEEAGPLGATPLHSQVGASYTTARTAITAAADLMTPGKAETKEEVKNAVTALHDARTEEGKAQIALDSLSLLLEQTNKKIEELEAIEQNKLMNVWCADYTTEIETLKEVGTIEVPGEYTEKGRKGEILIRPGFQEAQLEYHQTRDGYNTPVQALTACGNFYNQAMLPAWQKWRPSFRFAKVKKINSDGTLTIELLNEEVNNQSSQQALNITPQPLPNPNNPTTEPEPVDYEKVPVEYMDCHAGAFFIDDEVLVEYEEQQAEKPRVIGFRKEPRSCNGIMFFTEADDKLQITAAVAEEDEDTWTRTVKDNPLFEDTYWVGTNRALSWKGRKRRLFGGPPEDAMSKEIYQDGKLLATAPFEVMGATLIDRHLVAICTEPLLERETAYWKVIGEEGPWIELDSIPTGFSAPGYPASPFSGSGRIDTWIFSESGLKGACAHQTGFGGQEIKALVTFQLTITEGVLSGEFTVNLAITPEITTENTGGSTCTGGGNPADCETHRTAHTITRYFRVAADFIGEDLYLFDYLFEDESAQDESYGPAFEDCHVGGNGYAEDASGTRTASRVVHLLCEALSFDLLLCDLQSAASFTQRSYGVDAANELGCVPYLDVDGTTTATQQGFALEHLNVSAGSDKVVVVGRALNLTRTTVTSSSIAPFGGAQLSHPEHNTSNDTVSGTQTVQIRVGPTTPVAVEAAVNSTVTESSPFSQEAADIRAMFQTGTPYTLAHVACDRKAHVVYSSPLFEFIVGVPTLPAETAGGNHAQFVKVGMG